MLASLRSWTVVFLPALSLRHYNTHEFLNTRTRQASCLSGSLAKRRDSTACRARSKLRQVRRVLIDRVLRFFSSGCYRCFDSNEPFAICCPHLFSSMNWEWPQDQMCPGNTGLLLLSCCQSQVMTRLHCLNEMETLSSNGVYRHLPVDSDLVFF